LAAVAVVAAGAFGQASAPRVGGPPGSFMSARGAQLVLDGKPFEQVGFNKPDLPAYFRWGRNEDLRLARGLLDDLCSRGFGVLRVELFPSGPAQLEAVLADQAVRNSYLDALDQMLQACEDHGMLLVCSLMSLDAWADLGHHSLGEAMRNPDSPGRLKGEAFIRLIVGRYQRRSIIAAWEIGPQYNLAADLQLAQGPLEDHQADAPWRELHPAPVVRDGRNNFTSDELATFVAQVARLIRSIDADHLISAGYGAPRREAMHLLRACRQKQPPQYRDDNLDEQAQYLGLINPDPVDVICVSHFEMTPTHLTLLKAAADRIGKPMVVGRIGLSEPWTKPPRYDEPAAVDLVRCQLPVLRELHVPLTLYWRLADMPGPTTQPALADHCCQAGATEEVLQLLAGYNRPESTQQAGP
jgi:hypothetical protein